MSLDHGHGAYSSPRLRERFPILERLVYVNSCSQGALSDAVHDAYAEYLRDWQEHGSPWDVWVEKTEEARRAFAALIGAEADEVAVTASVSAAVSALATGLRFEGERTKVVLTEQEFPTVGQIWHAQEDRGATVVHAREPEAAVDDETLLVSATHASYRTGRRFDIAGIARAAHDRGALFLLDAYQTAGWLPLDVGELDVDFLVAGTTKYLLGSPGLGFFYCRRGLAERIRPTATGWFADEDVSEMDANDYSPARDARRFQAGTPPVPSVYAGIAGIGLVREADVAQTAAHVEELATRMIAGVEERGGRVVTPRDPASRGALVCVAARDAHGVVAALRSRGIVTSERGGAVRVSFHFYSSTEDVDAVLAALDQDSVRAML